MRNTGLKSRQRGLSFVQMILWGVVIVIAAIGVMKVVPAYVENRTINSILNKVSHDPDMQGASDADIRNSYEKGALMNNINVINSQDINIVRVPGGVVLSVKYNVKIELVGNVSLLLEFNSTSAKIK